MKRILTILGILLMSQVYAQNKWERPYFKKGNQKGLLMYAIYGVNNLEMNLSKSKHNITGFHDKTEIITFSKTKSESNKNQVESLYQGYLGKFLKEKNSELYTKTINSDDLVEIKLEVDDQENLEYLRNVIGVVQSVIEQGAVSILDLQTLTWYTPSEWSDIFFKPKKENIFKETIILFSQEEGGFWLHTRGMRKFARPDISIRNVPQDKFEVAKELIQRFINYYAQGGLPDESKEIKVTGSPEGMVGKIKGDYDNFDFNNYYFDISWDNH